MSSTLLYLVRHGATEANLVQPPRIQGRRHDPPLAPQGVCQAEATRDFLATVSLDHCYSSPLLRATQTACVVTASHCLSPVPLDPLTECDVGQWEGLDWQTVRDPGGENFAQVYQPTVRPGDRRAARPARRQAILVVSHHIVLRTCLAGLLGLPLHQARQVVLDNCGVSVVVRDTDRTTVSVLNGTRHLERLDA